MGYLRNPASAERAVLRRTMLLLLAACFRNAVLPLCYS